LVAFGAALLAHEYMARNGGLTPSCHPHVLFF